MKILDSLRKELRFNSDKRDRDTAQRFFKEPVKTYGIKTALVTQIGKKYLKEINTKTKQEIFDLCENLWQSGYMEESFIACNWSYALRKQYQKNDFKVFEKWLKTYVDNWASCDTFCNHTVGEIMMMFPELIKELFTWTKSKNRWERRGSAVSLIVPARRGLFLTEIFMISDFLLIDNEDMVQKGYGWLLKVASQTYQQEVFEYVMENKKRMPRTALRYAIEKMPQELKKKAMAR